MKFKIFVIIFTFLKLSRFVIIFNFCYNCYSFEIVTFYDNFLFFKNWLKISQSFFSYNFQVLKLILHFWCFCLVLSCWSFRIIQFFYFFVVDSRLPHPEGKNDSSRRAFVVYNADYIAAAIASFRSRKCH